MIYIFPYQMHKPINQYSDGTMVMRLREDKLPKGKKGDILQVNTDNGVCFISLDSVKKAPLYEQVFKIPEHPMKLRQIVIRPITEEQQERIKYDSCFEDDEAFIRSLIK